MQNNLHPSWTPPQDFIQVESQVPGVVVYAPRPESAEQDQARSYACPNCGANIAYDVAAGGVACEYCGYSAPVQAKQVGKSAENFEFTLEAIAQSSQGWGVQRQILHCDSCGGDISIPDGTLTATCPFCASHQVNVVASVEETLRPRFLVPFKITPQQTRSLAGEWLGKGWYHPKELSANTVLQRLTGVYLPFWTFNTRVRARWRAQVGYERTSRQYNARTKRWETRTKIVWRWEDGHVRLNIEDHLVSGSANRHISHQILNRLLPFHLNALVAYEPDYLAGWQAQAYETTLTEAWEIGKRAIREQAKKACHRDIPTSHVRNFSMSADFTDEAWRYILMPVYLAAYQFEDQIYQVMLNGQTGVVAGQKPVAWWKVWLVIAALLAPGVFLGLIGLPLLMVGGIGVISIGLSIILFVVGVIISFMLYNQARQSEAK